jgi:hypothetical protein
LDYKKRGLDEDPAPVLNPISYENPAIQMQEDLLGLHLH